MTKKVLHIASSPRGAASVSRQLGKAILTEIKAKYPDSVVTLRDLSIAPPPFLDEQQIGALFTPPEARTPEQLSAIKYADDVIAELLDADIIVMEAPLYNFGVVAPLKAYLDLIARPRVTFQYNEQGQPEGLLLNKKVYIAFSAGGIYSEGPRQSFDFVLPYLRLLLGFLGLTDITVVRAEGINMPEHAATALPKAIESIAID